MARIALAHFEPLFAERLASSLRLKAHSVCAISPPAHAAGRIEPLSLDLLILDVSSYAPGVETTLHEAARLRWETGLRPSILCVSNRYRGARFQFQLERQGIRVVYSLDIEQMLRIVDLVLFELVRFDHNGPDISIVHRYRIHAHGAQCQAGEEVARIVASHQGRQSILPLSLAPRLLFDFLARTKHTPQSAVQIAGQMRLHPFYRLHGMNCGTPSTRTICKSCIKEYAKRIRKALSTALDQIALPLRPDLVLVADLAGNEARYVLQASISWIHVNDLAEAYPRIRRAA